MNFKVIVGWTVGVVVAGVLALGVMDAEAKTRVSSKPSSFSRPAYSAPKVSRPAVVSRPTSYTTTKQTPVYRTPASSYRPAQKTTIIQKNYYGGNGGHSNYGGGYGGNGYGHGGSGGGLGTSIVGGAVGAAGGMLLMDALTEDEGEKALKLQQEQIKIEEARAQQERDDKQDQIIENQKDIEQELEEQDEGHTVIPEPSDSFFKMNPQLIPAQ